METNNALLKYLSELNSAESNWGIWVNPENTEEFRIGQFIFENGGVKDDWVCIGTLDNLSFGFQSYSDAIAYFLDDLSLAGTDNAQIEYKGKKILVAINGIKTAYSEGTLAQDFLEFLKEEAEEIMEVWAKQEAENYVFDVVPDLIKQAKVRSHEESGISRGDLGISSPQKSEVRSQK